MDEFIWGVTTIKPRDPELLDRIAKRVGGPACGFAWAELPDGARGWFYGPNRGEPFDSDLARRVSDEAIIAMVLEVN